MQLGEVIRNHTGCPIPSYLNPIHSLNSTKNSYSKIIRSRNCTKLNSCSSRNLELKCDTPLSSSQGRGLCSSSSFSSVSPNLIFSCLTTLRAEKISSSEAGERQLSKADEGELNREEKKRKLLRLVGLWHLDNDTLDYSGNGNGGKVFDTDCSSSIQLPARQYQVITSVNKGRLSVSSQRINVTTLSRTIDEGKMVTYYEIKECEESNITVEPSDDEVNPK